MRSSVSQPSSERRDRRQQHDPTADAVPHLPVKPGNDVAGEPGPLDPRGRSHGQQPAKRQHQEHHRHAQSPPPVSVKRWGSNCHR